MRRESTTDSPVWSNPGDDSILSLEQKIEQAQARVKALGELISQAMSDMYQATVQLERLQEEARLGPFAELLRGLNLEGIG